MDAIECKRKGMEFLNRFRYVILIFLLGLFLLILPEPDNDPPEQEAAAPVIQQDLQGSLAQILSKIEGAGHTEVLLTQAAGETRHYQTDDQISQSSDTKTEQQKTVMITSAERSETGLIRRTDPPRYQGAIVLCQGADDPKVKLAIVNAVSNATGLTTDKITVLKMK